MKSKRRLYIGIIIFIIIAGIIYGNPSKRLVVECMASVQRVEVIKVNYIIYNIFNQKYYANILFVNNEKLTLNFKFSKHGKYVEIEPNLFEISN